MRICDCHNSDDGLSMRYLAPIMAVSLSQKSPFPTRGLGLSDLPTEECCGTPTCSRDDLSVHFEHQTKHAVRSRMLWTEIEREVVYLGRDQRQFGRRPHGLKRPRHERGRCQSITRLAVGKMSSMINMRGSHQFVDSESKACLVRLAM